MKGLSMDLYERLKHGFREFERRPESQSARAAGWWPEAADLACVVLEVLRDDPAVRVVVNLDTGSVSLEPEAGGVARHP